MIKKISGMLFLVALIFGQGAASNISKVTYFPISYVGYHDVNATHLEVGVGRVLAGGVLGNAQTSQPLQVTDATSLAAGAALRLNGTSFQDTTIRVNNSPANIGYGQENLGTIYFAQNLKIGGTGYLTNLNTPVAKVQTLTLFGKAFPRCEAAADSDGNNMYWVRLKLGAGDTCSWYLSCGAVAEENQCTM